ncbi:MAG: VWA domain-containing protein [Planctomycetes bacterium]|nr:VWA domain-containing protein [Planctomycetota bacterium]
MELRALGGSWLVAALASLALPFGDDWKSQRAELVKACTADQDRATRENAITKIGGHPGVDPTRALLTALDECLAEQELLQARFDELSKEVQEILVGKQDVRLAAPKTKGQIEERKKLGDKMLEEAALEEHLLATLGKRNDDESVMLLGGLVGKPADWRTRARLLDVVGRVGRKETAKDVHGALRDKDPRVRIAAIDAAVALKQSESAPFVASLLGDKEWPVRAAAVAALRKFRDRTTVTAAIDALAKETGRLREELADLLSELTGQTFGGEARAWAGWWEQNRESFLAAGATAVAGAPAAGTPGPPPANAAARGSDEFSYYGIKTTSDKVVFVLDISDSMNDDAGETELPADGIPKRVGNLRPKIQVARDQLAQTIVDLPGGATFALITYNKFVKAWQDKLVPANKRWKNEALSYVLGIQATDATNIFDALELALSLGGRGLADKYYASQVDTIFFLTDGKATEGRIQEPAKILDEIRRINKFGKVKIHTIGVGYLHDRPFLEQLAKENGGTYVNVQ